jgi:hypothetical protein
MKTDHPKTAAPEEMPDDVLVSRGDTPKPPHAQGQAE